MNTECNVTHTPHTTAQDSIGVVDSWKKNYMYITKYRMSIMLRSHRSSEVAGIYKVLGVDLLTTSELHP